MDPYPWDWWEAVLLSILVCFTEIFILVVVERPFVVHSHNNNLHVQNYQVGVGVILATASVLATSGGRTLLAIVEFVSVTSIESYASRYCAQKRIRRYRVKRA
jgi:hypothetical protein